ncbi:serine hydrolase [Aerococcaceae bacterium DSM 109653]|uniref:Serine hydrolase n=2 Tax=Fundicoccus ignavus TaxID=2664442 RepID=A0A844BV65_9LACT|nr:serine hydrolase [Fundicoccus ignavus]
MSVLSVGVTASAQVENITKIPNLSKDIQEITQYEAIEIPENYPQELLDWYASNIDARSYVVVDTETNKILAQQEANVPYPIASMSKVMAMYMVYKAIDEGKLSLDTKITIPQEIEDYFSFNPEMSAVGLYAGEEYSVEDLIHGVMFLSGNDATSALLWEIYGSEQAAVQAIRVQLTDWGFTNFEFYTVSGIPNLYLPEELWIEGSNENSENKMSAADVALMSQYVVETYPALLDITSKYEYVFAEGTENEQVFYTTNLLLDGQAYGREGITGLKSGMTDAAGRNFVSTSTENGRKVIAVVMGLFDREDGLAVTTYWETEILLDALLDYPDLYQLEGLASNKHLTREEREAELAKLSEENAQAELAEQGIELENRRDSPVTNFMRNLFNIFQ